MKVPISLTIVLASLLPVTFSATCTSDADCVAENGFCGRDGNCTTYSCQNWFANGPEEFTGSSPDNAVELSCADYAAGATDNANSIVFGCRPYSPGNKAPERKTWTHFFNEECTASPGGGMEFKCYQNKEGADYTEYTAEVARNSVPSCEEEFENALAMFWYIKEARRESKDGTSLATYGKGRENTTSTESFDPSEADKTFLSMVITDGASSSGGESSPVSGSSGGGSSSGCGRAGFLAVGAAGVFLSVIWFL